jgi:hypothetical protein
LNSEHDSNSSCAATVCIATADRPALLRTVLNCWQTGTALPAEVRVVDASTGSETRDLCAEDWTPLKVTYIVSSVRGAVQQRNAGLVGVRTPIVVFCDDDVEIPKETLCAFLTTFTQDGSESIGGVAGFIEGTAHRVPTRRGRWYFRLQAGYRHEHYGGRVIGPMLNLLPTDRPEDPVLYESEWLNTTLAAYRTPLVMATGFPPFTGYGFQEDVSLSWRIGRTHKLYFDRDLRYVHDSAGGAHKVDQAQLHVMKLAHRWYNASQLLEMGRVERCWRFLLSELVDSTFLVRRRPHGWFQSMLAGWGAWWSLAIIGADPLVLARGQECR